MERTTATQVVVAETTGPGGLRVRRHQLPPVAAGQALVAVEAAGVAFAEVQLARGVYYRQPRRTPFVPGYDVVGRVEAVGPGVTDVTVGQRVAALTEFGGWADRVVLDADMLVPVPDGVSPVDAVSLVLNGLTAWQMLHRLARVGAGQTVLVHGASGGVGVLLAQLARDAGARVIGTASAGKHEALRRMGVEPVDYRSGDVGRRVRELAPDGVDAVFDHVGPRSLDVSWGLLRRGGVLVGYGAIAAVREGDGRWRPLLGILARMLRWRLRPRGRRFHFYNVTAHRRHARTDLGSLYALLVAGRITSSVAAVHPLERAGDALAALESGAVVGKIVLTPGTPGTGPTG